MMKKMANQVWLFRRAGNVIKNSKVKTTVRKVMREITNVENSLLGKKRVMEDNDAVEQGSKKKLRKEMNTLSSDLSITAEAAMQPCRTQ